MITLWLFNSLLWKMAHRNRLFSQLETSIYNGLSIAMLNDQMVPVSSFLKPELSNSFNKFSSFLEIL